MSDNVEWNALKVCRDLVKWWDSLLRSQREHIDYGMSNGQTPAFIADARSVLADYDAFIAECREERPAGYFSEAATKARAASGEIQG